MFKIKRGGAEEKAKAGPKGHEADHVRVSLESRLVASEATPEMAAYLKVSCLSEAQ